jgi:uncharacterized protein (TIGR03067 family)
MRWVMPLLAALSLALAPAPFPRSKPDEGKAALNVLQGEWSRVRVTVGGVPHSEVGNETTIVITGDRMKYANAGKPSNEWTLRLDGKAAPARLDRKGVSEVVAGFDYLGIYRIEGDTFTLCSCYQRRPTEFGEAGRGVYLEVFERVKR